MKKAAAALELLIVIIIGLIIYFTCFHNTIGRSDPFTEQKNVRTQQQVVEKKIKEINNTKEIKEKIEQNMVREQY